MPTKKKTTAPTTLDEALRLGDLAATRALLDAGADPNAPSPHGALPLGTAVDMRGLTAEADAIARLLLERGADPWRVDASDETPVARAAYVGADALVREMVARGGDRIDLGADDDMPLLNRACTGGLLWLVQRCVAAGADPLWIDASGFSALHHATSAEGRSEATVDDRLALVDWLLDRGCDPNLNRPGEYGGTPLHHAAMHAPAPVIGRLLDRGADPLARVDVSQRLPLHCAIYNGPDAIRLLCERGARADATDGRGQQPLHLLGARARYSEQPGNVDALVDHGANINALDADGVTPLGVAIAEHASIRLPLDAARVAFFARFVARGADLRCAAPGGATMLILAARLGDAALAQVALAGSELRQYDGHGWSALHYAATQSDGALVGALLAAGADPKQPTRKQHKFAKKAFAAGAKPVEIARAVGATAVVERLAQR